jgi:chemotaxis protein CheZ
MNKTQQFGRGQVIEIIHSVLDKVDASKTVSREVYTDLAELAQTIDHLKKEIALAQPAHVKNSHIPDATDELDEVVRATAEATHTIMGVCEEIEGIADGMQGAEKDEITARVTKIYEACGFQDITGQRIRNVIGTLRVIEDKIDRMLESLSDAVGVRISDERAEKIVSVDDSKSLMSGPQLPTKAITQSDIDKLLADFDKP